MSMRPFVFDFSPLCYVPALMSMQSDSGRRFSCRNTSACEGRFF